MGPSATSRDYQDALNSVSQDLMEAGPVKSPGDNDHTVESGL